MALHSQGILQLGKAELRLPIRLDIYKVADSPMLLAELVNVS